MLDEFHTNSQRHDFVQNYLRDCLSLTERKPMTKKRFNELKQVIEEYRKDLRQQAERNYEDDVNGLQENYDLIDMECSSWLKRMEDEYKHSK